MSYSVRLDRSAERELKRLPAKVLGRVDAKLGALAEDPRPRGAVKLQGRGGEGWRIRVGSYRILFTIDDAAKVVTVYRIGLRSSVYR